MSSQLSTTGLTCSILASLLFGLIPWYVQFLEPLDGSLLFWNRILFSAITAFIALVLFKQLGYLRALFSQPKNVALLSVGTALVAVQWWLFVWAPVNDLTTELSLGYFFLPLTLVLTGRIAYGEKLRPLQLTAAILAAIGVGHEIYQFGSLSWVAVAVAAGYPFYFLIRRKVKVNSLTCFFFENMLLLPFALFAIATDNSFSSALMAQSHLYLLLPGLGVLTTAAMLVYVAASKSLPVSLFGLLSYLEPVIIFMVAVFILREPLPTAQWVTYGFIWMATMIICIDSIRIIVRRPAVV
ncbi:EamA family transporter RarD [uncultured Endozoicomonas sp.]|uniref:EamA family transporter RarD n=1 Tax=uncultured Endozoicomonas sp. TaxID=432652 RepID=UPI0026355A40|nr:EamA family transporter RarD [uncultured Endozoicomonas sp.]